MWASSAPRTRSLPPRVTASTTTTTTAVAGAQALTRFEQACVRLRWKSIDLEHAYARAQGPGAWAFSAGDAERNFKVDFYEYYAWLERAVVLLLGVFGTVVDAGAPASDGGGGDGGRHAYHHNVLRALDDAAHPLHRPLGRGGAANDALWRAKELRNRWKHAAEGRPTPPLAAYDLGAIVGGAARGLEAAYLVAAARVRDDLAAVRVDVPAARHGDDSWDWMVEPMDWEA